MLTCFVRYELVIMPATLRCTSRGALPSCASGRALRARYDERGCASGARRAVGALGGARQMVLSLLPPPQLTLSDALTPMPTCPPRLRESNHPQKPNPNFCGLPLPRAGGLREKGSCRRRGGADVLLSSSSLSRPKRACGTGASTAFPFDPPEGGGNRTHAAAAGVREGTQHRNRRPAKP